MAAKEFHPSIRDERKTFRYGTNRMVEIALQHELDDVAKKSLDEIAVKKEHAKFKPVDNEEYTARRLRPAFRTEKRRQKRKTEPLFQEEYLAKESKKQPTFMLIPDIPPYNPLDKYGFVKEPDDKIRKYPYLKDNTITTYEMKQPRVTSMGVLPLRTSVEVPNLNVIMEGKPISSVGDQALAEIEEANLVKPMTPGTPDEVSVSKELQLDLESEEPQKKPAILGSEGTMQKLKLSVRPKKVPHPPTVKRKLRGTVKSGVSVASSLRSGEIVLPDEKIYSKYDSAIAGIDTDLENVETAVGTDSAKKLKVQPEPEDGRSSGALSSAAKSVKDMLDEARKIVSPGAEPVHRMRKTKKEGKKETKKAREKEKGQKEEKGPRSERTVDEIIASLRSQSRSGQQTDADRKIQEIMDRVMSRSSGVSGEETIIESKETQKRDSDLRLPIQEVDEKEADEAYKREAEKYMEERMKDLDLPLPPAPPATAAHLVEPLTGLGDTSEEEEDTTEIDIRKAWEDINMPDVTHEDLVGVTGKTAVLEGRHPPLPGFKEPPSVPVQSGSVSFLSAWKPVAEKRKHEEIEPEERPSRKSVHHFCRVTTEYQLPEQFQNVGRKYHTPSRFEASMPDQKYRFGSRGPSAMDVTAPQSRLSQTTDGDEEARIAAAARRVLKKVSEDGTGGDNTLEAWEKRAEQVFEQPQLTVEGSPAVLRQDESRLYWTPAPPKLDVAPGRVKDLLFPEYQRPSLGRDEYEDRLMEEESSSSEEEEGEVEVTDEDRERMMDLDRTLTRTYRSSEDLTELTKASVQREGDIKEGKIHPYAPFVPFDEDGPLVTEAQIKDQFDRESSMTRESGRVIVEPTDSQIFPVFVPLRRSTSAPVLDDEQDETLIVPQDYNIAMEEIRRQKQYLRQLKIQRRLGNIVEPTVVVDEPIESLQRVEPSVYQEGEKLMKLQAFKKEDEQTPAELALAAGRAYVILPKKRKKKRASVSMSRLDDVETFLRKQTKKLKRSESMMKMPRQIERDLRVSTRIREGPRRSMPDIFNFDEYGSRKGLTPEDDTREWVRGIWNTWFDEVFPPTPSDSEFEDEEMATEEQQDQKAEEERKKRRKASMSSSVPGDLEYIHPVGETDENLEVQQIIIEEIQKLTEEMNYVSKPKAFDYCRRGALYRKIGYLKAAEEDLTQAMQIEPLLLDAYWNRHLLYVLQDRKKEALEDLQFILKNTQTHAGAYRSMAEIYKKQDDITMAIVNYTQAIKLNPRDHEAYYTRAECYEKRGDMLLALEDFSCCTKIAPTRTDAILKHGMYYFENRSWSNAINDFTDLLRVDPLNSATRVLRGRSYASMGQWSAAVEDLSAAIHLDPDNWEAFYQRACILRKAHPKRALEDYSISLMINDTEDNINAYLHRGILYNTMNKPEDAAADFESVLKLNKDVACAHVNLGLIMMKHYENYHRAIKRFTSAIKVDPTYIRAYVCRGEAYHKVHELKQALRDFTRAIHLRPDVHHYYMYRGQLLLEMGNLDLAAFCVRHASEIGSDSGTMGQRPTQQAVVQSFLKNYEKAIEALQAATRSKPVASMFMLLGKTQMKAKQFEGAIVSFEKALQLYKPWKERDPWPTEAADSHYLIGQCNMERRNYLEALEAFTSAIKLNPSMAEALYDRGNAKMKLKMFKGIQDFNRALAINPKIFQAYLSRACYYGMKGYFTKAILNCNEAIKLQPLSVRAYLYRGALKYHIRAFDLAILDLTKAGSIDGQCPLAFFNRAVCYQENKDYEKALTDYGIVLLLGEQLKLKVLINRGLLYFEKKDYTNALYDFKMAAILCPNDHKILHTLGLCYHKLNQLQEAVKVFTTCIKSQPFFLEGVIARGNVYMDYGHEDGLKFAMRDYERVLKNDPLCLPARVNLAYTLQVSGRFMQAWRQFTIAIDLKPNYKPALEGRSIINLQMSDTFAAYRDIGDAVSIDATAELLTNRGVIHQFMGERVNAMRDYQEALELDSTYSLAYFNAANVYFHNRQFTQALDYYTRTVRYNNRDESAFLNRAITKVMLKDAKGALADFKTAIKLSPYSAHMYFNRGNLYASTQQYELADKDYTKALSLQPDDALVLRRRAVVRGKLGQKDAAISDYRQAIELQGRMQYLKSL